MALFWHDIWRQNNSPRNGLLADIMRSTRAKYNYSIRFIHKKQSELKRSKVADALASGSCTNFWYEVKKLKGCNQQIVNNIDGLSNDNNIAQCSADKFSAL